MLFILLISAASLSPAFSTSLVCIILYPRVAAMVLGVATSSIFSSKPVAAMSSIMDFLIIIFEPVANAASAFFLADFFHGFKSFVTFLGVNTSRRIDSIPKPVGDIPGTLSHFYGGYVKTTLMMTCYLPVFFGRPGGLRRRSRPSSFSNSRTNSSLPKGRPVRSC